MEINNRNFQRNALDIIESIAQSDFVAIDFEFSGVAANAPRATGRVRDSLQERYVQVKAAAEKFTILQVGLTCARQTKDGDWVLKTYNIPISPVLDEELQVQRDFAFQSGAVQFLIKNGFNFSESLTHGVQYLSQKEEGEAMLIVEQRQDKSQISDITLKDTDLEALAFMREIRRRVDSFLKTRITSGLNAFDILNHTDLSGTIRDLSGYDRRLIHQLIRAEYPQLITLSRNGTITIRIKNQDRENEHQARRLEKAKSTVRRHIGFRHIIDALCGHDIGSLECYQTAKRSFNRPDSPSSDSNEAHPAHDTAKQYTRVVAALKHKRPVIVGHNIINDLIYLHAAFLLPLPDTAAAFAESIHAYFPLIIDTKFMATYNNSSMNPTSGLAKLEQDLALEASISDVMARDLGTSPVVQIKTEAGFEKYDDVDLLHEAGYDAYITARVFIRLAAKLNTAVPSLFTPELNEDDGSVVDVDIGPVLKNISIETKYVMNRQFPARSKSSGSRFAVLEDDDDGGGIPLDLDEAQAPPEIKATGESTRRLRVVPSFANAEFWQEYGNRLRVFGTHENEMKLAE